MEEINRSNEIQCISPSISFPTYLDLIERAKAVADTIDAFEINEDNVKEAKEILANARKLTGALDDRRKEIKRQILAPYQILETQIKEINGIIDAADERLRTAVRDLEDAERDKKEEAIREIWELRVRMYSFTKYIENAYDMWLEPRFMNKSMSMKQVEAEMTAFMETTEKDVSAILMMPNAEEVMTEYAGTLNLAEAIAAVERANAYKERFSDKERATFIITGSKDIELAKRVLAENNINFKVTT